MPVDIQFASQAPDLPPADAVASWAQATLGDQAKQATLTVRIVDEAEGARLSQQYRGGAAATNVLSFPFDAGFDIGLDLLGDVVVCAPVVRREAREQGKAEIAHWAHMVVHGTLHLLGYEHEGEDDAQEMEAQERVILAGLGFPDPYASERAGEALADL